MKALLIATALATVAFSADAAKMLQPPLDIGSEPCNSWIYYRTNEWNKQQPNWSPNVRAMGWVAGFLNAWGMGSQWEGKLAGPSDVAEAWDYLDQYCAAHPAEPLINGAFSFGRLLLQRALKAEVAQNPTPPPASRHRDYYDDEDVPLPPLRRK